MCSSAPKAPKINPYAGFGSGDERFQAAVAELGIKNLDSQNDINAVNKYIAKEDEQYLMRNPNFDRARQELIDEGTIVAGDPRSRTNQLIGERLFKYDTDADIAAQAEENAALQQEFTDMMAQQAKDQQEAMEALLNAPTYSAKQGDLPPVMAPVVQPKPIPVAPPTPTMKITRTPPAPELTQTQNQLAIVRQPATARTRQRQRSRGTSSLSTGR